MIKVNSNFSVSNYRYGSDSSKILNHSFFRHKHNKNKNINKDKTDLNRWFKTKQDIENEIKTKSIVKPIGKQAKALQEIVSTINLDTDPENFETAQKWFNESIAFFNKEYKTIAGAVLHCDETHFHAHYFLINQHPNKKGTMIWGNSLDKVKLNQLHEKHIEFMKEFAKANNLEFSQEPLTNIKSHAKNINDAKSLNPWEQELKEIDKLTALGLVNKAKLKIKQLESNIHTKDKSNTYQR